MKAEIRKIVVTVEETRHEMGKADRSADAQGGGRRRDQKSLCRPSMSRISRS